MGRMSRKAAVAAFCMCLVVAVKSTVAVELGEEGNKAFNRLKAVTSFALGGVGYAALTSEGEKAYRVVRDHKEAVAAFRALLSDKDATMAGKLYALVGLKIKDPKGFEKEAAPFLSDQTKVLVWRGCIMSRDSAASIAKRIKDGVYDLMAKKSAEK